MRIMSCIYHTSYISIYAIAVILSTLTLSKELKLDCQVHPRNGSTCYTVYVDDKLNQSEAARRCRQTHQNGRLATVLDPRTSAHLTINLNKLNATRQEYWIGAQLQLMDKWTWLNGTEDSTIFRGEYGYAKAIRNQLNQTQLLAVPFGDPVDDSADALCMKKDCGDTTTPSCYFLKSAHRWHDARNKCTRNHDADLALSLPPGVMRSNRRYFVGLRRVLVTWNWNSSQGRTTKTGKHVEDLAYSKWMHTAPRTTNELCLVLKDDYSSWRWDVANCSANRSFICEHNGSNTTRPVRTPSTRSSQRRSKTTQFVTTHSNSPGIHWETTLTQRPLSTTVGPASSPGENLVTLTDLVSTRKVNTKQARRSSSTTTSKTARVSPKTTSRHSTIKPTRTTASTSRATTKTSSSSSTTTTTTSPSTTTTTTDRSTLVITVTVARSSKNPVPLNVQSPHSSSSPERASAGPSPVLLVCSILVIIVIMIVFIVVMVVVRLNIRRKSSSSTSHSSPVVATNVNHPVVNGQPQQDPASTVSASGGPSTDQYAAVIRRHSSRTHKRTGSVAAGVHSFTVVEPQHSEAVALRLSKQENGELARGRESQTQKMSRLSTPLGPSDGHHTVDDNGNNVVYADILPSKYPHDASTPDTPVVYASLDNVTQPQN